MPGKQTRRRGAALDHALLTAAWDELMEKGYENLTMESVAERAQTSRPVISRRWSDRRALVAAAMTHWYEQNPIANPDTGSLRGDLLAFLEEKSDKRTEHIMFLHVRLGAFMKEAGNSPAQFKAQMAGIMTSGLDEIWERAVTRGEVDPAALTPRIRVLPAQLLGAEIAQSRQPVARATIEEILDTIVLPLVTGPGKH